MNTFDAYKVAQDPDRLAVLRSLELLDTPTDDSFDRLTRLASQITNSPVSLVSLVDVNRQYFKSQVGLPAHLATLRQTPLSHSFCKHVVAENAPLIVKDAREHPILRNNLAIAELDVIGYLGMPLTTTDGIGLGSFCVIDNAPRNWSLAEIDIMLELSFMVMTEIELRAQIKARARAENALKEYTNTLEVKVAQRTEELQEVYEQLQKNDRLKSKFIDDISHELRTPITNINLYLDLLTEGNQENRKKYETVIREQSLRLNGLVEGILDFANLQKILEQPNLTFLDLNALVKEVIPTFEQLSQTRDIDFIFTPEMKTLPVWGDAGQLKQVVSNLLQNAIAYTPSGYVHLSTHHKQKDGPIQLTVSDSGIGMDEEERDHCFRRFYRGKRVGQFNDTSGVGLGLAQIKNILSLHKGWVEVKSELNQGSTFSIYLPAVSPPQ